MLLACDVLLASIVNLLSPQKINEKLPTFYSTLWWWFIFFIDVNDAVRRKTSTQPNEVPDFPLLARILGAL